MKKTDWLFQISRQNERTNDKKSDKMRKNPNWPIGISRWNAGVLLVLLVVCCLFGRAWTSPLVSAFTTTDSLSFQHLAVNQQSGQVYIGGVNRIYQLSADLETLVAVETGPRDDSPDCPAVDCSPSVVRTPTDNYNKVLVVDEADNRLIVCGSLFQGICTIRSLQNVSEQLQEVHEPVAANSATASTVAFVGSGPASLSSGTSATRVLYAGVTYTANSPYRSEVPAVSSRSLRRDDMLQIAKTDVTTGTRIAINSLERERYPIRYVSGFSSGGFSYFLTTQRRATHANSPYISKLIRVCQNDTEYYSYTEVPLECAIENGIRYNLVQAAYVGKPGADLASQLKIQAQDDVLFAAFSPSDAADGETSSRASRQQSALCVYSLQSIRRKFMKNIQTCFNGEGSKGLDYISPNLPCIHTKLETIAEDFCGMDVNTPLGGEDPVAEAPVATFDVQVTAVAATSIGEFTVAFLGTVDGHLKKVVVESGRADWSRGGGAAEYSDAVIDEGSPVNPDLHLDPQKNHIYVMTTKKVTKVRVQDCGIHKNCGECLGARDPYCGWCSLENKCSLRSDCQDASKDPLYWISYKSGRCTTITSVTPHQLQRTTARTLSLVIDNLPSLSGQFQCAFSAFGKTLLTNATRTTTGVSCVTPRTDLIPPNLPGQHHFTAKLSVRVASGPDFVATNFTFFDCNTYASCSDCVSSAFPCDWCVDGHRCTHDTGENCRNDVLVTGVSRIGPSIQSGPAFCPRISSNSGNGVEILVPHGMKKIVKVKVDNIAQFILQTSFVCQFNIEGRVKMVPAQLIGDTIYCDSMEFSYSSKQPNITATFAVVWAGTKALDNPDNVRVLVYRCREMADNCGVCLALDEKFQCGWCQTSDSCDVRDQCDRGSVVGGSSLAAAGGSWLNRDQICPNPEIRRFFPVVGPWEGGTNITIEGVNLGRSLEDVGGAVSVAGMPCIPDASLYVPSRRIVCSVEGPKTSDARKGPVVVNVATKFKGISAENFEFVDPIIESVTPLKGPRSGGTLLTIMGQHMDAGSFVQAWIDPSLPCTILSRNSTHALCRTSSSEILRNGTLHMSFDLGTRSFRKDLYEYVEDPSVKYAESGVSARAVPKGVPAGGIGITVVGNNFEFVQDPKMYVILRDTKYVSQCQVVNSQRMNCESPAVPILGQQIPPDEPLHLDYGFLMDDVASVLNLSRAPGFSYFLLYPDPVFEKFDEEIKYYKSDYLTINGQHLDRACQESDVEVMIGTVPCNVTSLSRYQLTCRPPASQPPAAGSDPNNVPEVVVIVGKSKRHIIGKLSYESPVGIEAQLPKHVVIGIAVGSALLLIIFIAIVIAYRRKSTENSRVLKTMKEHMDMLELQVAAECKEAFAELQTEMTDLTSDLTSGGIPFLDYRTYAMKILFPSQDDPSLLQWDNSPELLRKEKGLRLFDNLLMNKTFLLVFIRTLESNRYFYMRDRVNVASLIMVTLQTKMEYCTDILKTLLADLIEKCMEGKSHPKLLLRRTESVAEKMLSAWFTFLLYKFLRECAGEPLYLLFRAIKHQVDKGPVDCVTSEARYSLSEEKLIRQSIEYKHMTVYVSISPQTMYVAGLDAHTDTSDTPVKVLDCDTVSQVKEKALDTIYRSTPYSQRPRKEDLDLEWRTGTSGRLVLFNEDSTSKSENDWKKLNTLAHYRVPDGALLTLIPRQSSMYFILPEKSSHATEKSLHKYETLNLNLSKFSSASPPVSRATSPMNHQGDRGHESEHGLKVWHLVRHQDHEGRKEGERANKMVSEIYLTRLLSTKITLQKYVDDLFETIFSTANRGSSLPLAIKYMFDFLDDQALQHGITDPEVVHTWKSNSLPLRFWVNLIKNPNFVFDVHKSNIVDSCLSVVAQTFMDSCSTSDHRLGKDSPSSKLLFAKDIPVYKEWVDRYYSDIKTMPAISDQEMNAMLAEESRQHLEDFNLNSALNELYGYAVRYQQQLTLALEEDEFSTKQRLAYRLEQVHVLMRTGTTNP